MSRYQEVFLNNRRWVEQRRAADPRYFEDLAKDQHPEFLYIGCSDSRVPANEIMGLGPGEVFVHRNIANLVYPIDFNVNAVIQYAVKTLHVKHIVVVGHYGCGGVRAAMRAEDLGLMNKWLRGVRDVYRDHASALNAITDPEKRHRRLVELNVREQCLNVVKTSWVQRSYLGHGYPIVHGWVFDVGEGILRDLEIPFEGMLAHVREVYGLMPDEEE